MDGSTIVWIIVAVVVLLVVLAIAGVFGKKKKTEHDRSRAQELREQAAAQSTGVQQHEAQARETEAEAKAARAEAERRAAEAQRLEAEAADKRSTAAGYREERDERLRQADELDPDRDTSTDDHPATEHTDEHRDGMHRA